MAAITNLYANYSRPYGQTGLPIVVVMHGYGGSAYASADVLDRMAAYGVFAAAPGMRGRNGASGSQDSSRREIADIYDCVNYISSTFAEIVDPDHVCIVGYSGGGGNVMAMAAKFPDFAQYLVEHFGISDYGVQSSPAGWADTNTTWMGGNYATVPDNYLSCRHDLAAANYSGGHMWLYHDRQDPTVSVVQSEQFADVMATAGLTNFEESYTDTGDPVRWTHNNPTGANSIIGTEANWLTAVAAKTYPAWTVPAAGTLRVCGYLVTKRFEVWLGGTTRYSGGLSEVATLVYDTVAGTYELTSHTGTCDAYVKQGNLTGTASGFTTTTITVA